jgi:hypothetical protein
LILDLTLKRGSNGTVENPVSKYAPSEKEKERLAQVKQHFEVGRGIMDRAYRQFNDLSVLQRQSRDQASFNAYVEPQSADPDEAWHSQAVRPIVRNRTISIAAHVTGSVIYPQVYAQNDQDQADNDAAEVMKDLMEWAGEQANYEKTFVYAVIAALVNPAVIVHTEYAESYRTIKEILAKGGWKEKRVKDELFSGFRDSIVPVDELFIGDIYEPEIQKQPFLIWRRAIDYTVALAKYGDNKNFKEYVKPGLQIIFDSETSQFYDAYDESLQNRLVEEVIYYNRTEDLQLVMLNGVLVTDPDQPNPRNDKNYPFVKTGYELFDEGKFFYYSSLAKKMSKDEEVLNTLYRMVIDGTYLQLMPPVAIFGDEDISSSIVTPGTITTFDGTTKAEALNIGANLSSGFAALDKVESSLSESSNDLLQSGQDNGTQDTAFEISRLEQNAKIMLGMFAKMIGYLVKDLGQLRMSDILQYLTVADVDELVSDGSRIKFQSFIVPNKTVNGKKKTRRIVLDNSIADNPKPPLDQSFDVMQQEGGLNTDQQLYLVAPKLFRELKFKVKVTPDTITPPSDNVKRALNLELYDRAIGSPYADQEALYSDLLLGSYDATKGDTEKYVAKQPMQPQGMQPNQPNQPTASGNPLSSVLGAGPNQALNKVAA